MTVLFYVEVLLLFLGIMITATAQRSLPNDIRIKYSTAFMVSHFGMLCAGVAFGIIGMRVFGHE